MYMYTVLVMLLLVTLALEYRVRYLSVRGTPTYDIDLQYTHSRAVDLDDRWWSTNDLVSHIVDDVVGMSEALGGIVPKETS